jgi:hypothetical protein
VFVLDVNEAGSIDGFLDPGSEGAEDCFLTLKLPEIVSGDQPLAPAPARHRCVWASPSRLIVLVEVARLVEVGSLEVGSLGR